MPHQRSRSNTWSGSVPSQAQGQAVGTSRRRQKRADTAGRVSVLDGPHGALHQHLPAATGADPDKYNAFRSKAPHRGFNAVDLGRVGYFNFKIFKIQLARKKRNL